MPGTLSKSHILAARQCRRRLWLQSHRPDLQSHDIGTGRRFSQGRQLNELLRRLYPDGHLIDEDIPPTEALRLTAAHLADHPGRPLFEGAFGTQQVMVRADMVQRTDAGLELTEFKSSTRVKQHQLIDCAVQHWVLNATGHPVGKTTLAHVNTRFIYAGNGDYAGLMRHVDVSEGIEEFLPLVPGWIDEGLGVLSQATEPDTTTGPHCTRPFPCPFRNHCGPSEPGYPVSLLPGGGRIIKQLQNEGIGDVREIPAGRLHKPLHERIRRATISGQAFVGTEITRTLRTLPYPRSYLDFEAIQFVIPRWPNTRPYQQLPFQWSCHTERSDGALLHEEFLDERGEAPMRACAEALIAVLGDQGTVFCYSRYERMVIHQLAARFTDLGPRLHALAERLFDLLPLVRAHYYHPAMKGSFSIKAVLPTIAPELAYDGLDGVNDGIGAQLAYEELIDPTTAAERRDSLSKGLRAYCGLDTLALVRMVRYFERR